MGKVSFTTVEHSLIFLQSLRPHMKKVGGNGRCSWEGINMCHQKKKTSTICAYCADMRQHRDWVFKFIRRASAETLAPKIVDRQACVTRVVALS